MDEDVGKINDPLQEAIAKFCTFSKEIIKRDCLEELHKILNSTQFDYYSSLAQPGTVLANCLLIYACRRGALKCVRLLLNFEADIQWESQQEPDKKKKRTPLHVACLCGYSDSVVTLLIERGADVDAKDAEGRTPLEYAMRKGHVECVKALLKFVKDVNSVTFNGETLLSFACTIGRSNVLSVLIEHGADVHIGNPVLQAVRYSRMQCLEVLLRNGADVNEKNSGKKTALMFSCEKGTSNIVDLLLQCGADVNCKYAGGRNAMTCAIEKRSVDCVDLLLKHISDINLLNCRQQTALFYACDNGHISIMRLLLNHGADVDARNRDGCTALMRASEHGYDHIARLLLDYRANVNAVDNDGDNAIVYASKEGYQDVLEVLLMAPGIDFNRIPLRCFNTVVSAAFGGDGSCMEKLLLSERFRPKTCIQKKHLTFLEGSSVKSVWLSMQFGRFDWSWVPIIPSVGMEMSVFPAVLCGISPGTYQVLNGRHVSSLIESFMCKAVPAIKYLLANLYFFPRDYRILTSKQGYNYIKKDIERREDTRALLEQLTTQPLSLQTWSFLVISESISQSGSPCERSARVDSLPLPELLKMKLKFKSDVSGLCSQRWKFIKEHRPGDLVFGNASLGISSENRRCSNLCEICGDLRGPSWSHLYKRYSSMPLPEFLPKKTALNSDRNLQSFNS